MVTVLHTADWQIGKQFAKIAGDAAAFLRERHLDAVKKISKLAEDRNVGAVSVAGDVFETNLVQGIMQKLSATGDSFPGKWIVIPGNHDSAEVSSFWTRVKSINSSNKIVILDQPEPYHLREVNTVVLPAPLQRRYDSRDLTAWLVGGVKWNGSREACLDGVTYESYRYVRRAPGNTIGPVGRSARRTIAKSTGVVSSKTVRAAGT